MNIATATATHTIPATWGKYAGEWVARIATVDIPAETALLEVTKRNGTSTIHRFLGVKRIYGEVALVGVSSKLSSLEIALHEAYNMCERPSAPIIKNGLCQDCLEEEYAYAQEVAEA